MAFLQDVIELVTIPPGALIYHLVTLFAMQLILGVAVGHWERHRREAEGARLLATAVGLLLTRVILMLGAGLDALGLLSADFFLPPLERFLDLAAILLVVWAFLPIFSRNPRLGLTVFLVALVASALVYAVFAALWAALAGGALSYNAYWQDAAWAVFAIAVLTLAGGAALIWREGDWSLLACVLMLWLAGYICQLAAPPAADSDVAGWVRLANLAALPLVAGLVYRRALGALPTPGAGAEDDEDDLSMLGILDAAQRIGTTPDLEAALKLTAPSIARALRADMVAFGLPLPGLAKKVRIVALHPSTGAMIAHQEPTLLASRYPVLHDALTSGVLQRAAEPEKDPAVVALYRQLGFERPAPLLVQPLLHEGEWRGVILAGNVTSRRPWTMRDEQVIQAVGAMITMALVEHATLPARAVSPEAPDARLQDALDEAQRLSERVMEQETELRRQRQEIEALTARLREQEGRKPPDDRARSALEAELAEWKGRAEGLAQLADELQAQLAEAQRRGEAVTAPPLSPAPEVWLTQINDVRTPMTSIASYTDLLLNESVGILGETQRQLLQRIRVNIERMRSALDDLGKSTRIGGAKPPSTGPEEVHFKTVLKDAAAPLAAQFKERRIGLRADVSPQLPPLHTDRDSLTQILTHLLSNACRVSQPGTQVTLQARLEEYDDRMDGLPDYLFVSVTDTGGGIAPEEQPRIFRRLYRADNPPIAGLGDNGVGLSVSKSLVEQLGGRLWVESEMGVGSTFSFILPMASPQPAAGEAAHHGDDWRWLTPSPELLRADDEMAEDTNRRE